MKLQNLTVENFRSFDHYTVNHLGRVNLLVGTNNSGKTSILEAAFVLMSSQPLSSIWSLLHRRGEVFLNPNRSMASVPTDLIGDVRHLFKDHTLFEDDFFKLSGESNTGHREMRVQAGQGRETESEGESNLSGSTSSAARQSTVVAASAANLVISITTASDSGNGQNPEVHRANLDNHGGLSTATIDRGPILSKNHKANYAPYFVVSTSINSHEIARAYNDIILTAEEELVLDAVRLISPKIKRIAPIGAKTEWSGLPSRDGIYVRLEGVEERVPLGSMGDGIWRMLGLALAVIHSRDGILLIDEIDTGLHYSVMGKMWRFLNDCSQRFNVQIIATTHSRDCYQSLAEICREGVIGPGEVTLQRIDRKRAEAVTYSEAAIIAAADRDLEVR